MIYTNDDGTCVISSHQCWLPGVYDCEKTARRAFRLTNQQLQSLKDMSNERAGGSRGIITGADIEELRKRVSA
jgi:hypothetical protein